MTRPVFFSASAMFPQAGINDHHIGIFIGRADAIAAGAQFGNDPFGVDQGFGASE